jgi:hypothetical protein
MSVTIDPNVRVRPSQVRVVKQTLNNYLLCSTVSCSISELLHRALRCAYVEKAP